MLNTQNHCRDSAGMKYIYPVISRRAGGVSIGINLNVNNACNWACKYCQVPHLRRGKPPAIDLQRLETELRTFLQTADDFLTQNAPPETRQIIDIALSGNGEPTSAPEFPSVVDIAGNVLSDFGLQNRVKLRLITNGSLIHRPYVQQGIAQIGTLAGEVWFKVDRGTREGIALVNGIQMNPYRVKKSLLICTELAHTWIQSCFFAIDGNPPDEKELAGYLDLVSVVRSKIRGILLYGLARPSQQPEANRLSALSAESLSYFAKRISTLGIDVITTP